MGLHCHMTKSYKAVDTLAPPQTKILATPLLSYTTLRSTCTLYQCVVSCNPVVHGEAMVTPNLRTPAPRRRSREAVRPWDMGTVGPWGRVAVWSWGCGQLGCMFVGSCGRVVLGAVRQWAVRPWGRGAVGRGPWGCVDLGAVRPWGRGAVGRGAVGPWGRGAVGSWGCAAAGLWGSRGAPAVL